ncbi:MAG TPA: nucleotide disphospho-sugar-binding domain-containing protein [Acidimicrobiales bacterium]|jgi:MGT family glycosyltransferase
MGCFLFVVPPLAGHVNPTISVGRELIRRGHDVAWAGLPGAVESLLPPDAFFLPAGSPEAMVHVDELRDRSQGLRAAAAFKFLWESVLIPLAHAMVDGVEAAVDTWQPDVVIADQQTLAGSAVAIRRGLCWATSATTSAEMVDALAGLPRAEEWADEQVQGFLSAIGMSPEMAEPGDLRCSDDLVLVFSSRRLVGEHRSFPPHYAFVGPSISDRPEPDLFPWEWLDPDVPHVLVSLGTVNSAAGERFFKVTAEALAGEALQAVFVAPPEAVPPARNFLVRRKVPQLQLLKQMDAVVSHGGHNTVCETLAHGLPLVLAPIRDDQPIVADQVVQAGAGVRVRFGRVLPGDLSKAVRSVLDEPSFRSAAGEIKRSFEAAGGAPAAASQLEALLCAD